MTGHAPHEVTLLLQDWCRGDRTALDKLMPLVYDELRRLAHRYMVREHVGHTLQTTALVNEAYLRLIDAGQVEWKDRAHFFAISANLMRRILVEFARSRGSRKRGGDVCKVELDEAFIPSPGRDTDLVALDDALNALAEIDSREAKVVELRFFGGLSVDETAEVLGISDKTVMREWNLAKVWLLQELKRSGKQ
jgi:RNA polymerase sigma factor (TIGR02999 family)